MQNKTKNTTFLFPFHMNLLPFDLQNTESVATTETLAEVPEHVLRGLPEEVRLLPSAVDKTRIGEYAHHRSQAAKRRLLPLGAETVLDKHYAKKGKVAPYLNSVMSVYFPQQIPGWTWVIKVS